MPASTPKPMSTRPSCLSVTTAYPFTILSGKKPCQTSAHGLEIATKIRRYTIGLTPDNINLTKRKSIIYIFDAYEACGFYIVCTKIGHRLAGYYFPSVAVILPDILEAQRGNTPQFFSSFKTNTINDSSLSLRFGISIGDI